MSWFRRALASGSEGRLKDIAAEAFPTMKDAAALAELGKYLNGERGESAMRVIEVVVRLGDRQALRTALEAHLRDEPPHVQLELLLPTVRMLVGRIEEIFESLPRAAGAKK